MTAGNVGYSEREESAGGERRRQAQRDRLCVDDVDMIVARLSKTNTSAGRRAVLWSSPRQEYEYNFTTSANLKTREHYSPRYTRIPRHYPGPWSSVSSGHLQRIVARLAQPTVAHVARARDNIDRRQVIERYHKQKLVDDIGLSAATVERLDSARPKSCRAPVREDTYCLRFSPRPSPRAGSRAGDTTLTQIHSARF